MKIKAVIKKEYICPNCGIMLEMRKPYKRREKKYKMSQEARKKISIGMKKAHAKKKLSQSVIYEV